MAAKKTNPMPSRKVDWSDPAVFSVLKASEGGTAYGVLSVQLGEAGIPCRRAHSPYVGHYGIAVPMRYARQAERIVFP